MATADEMGQVPHTAENLTIRTPKDLEDFWKAILPVFVQTADPRTTMFLDELYNDELLTHTDRESLVSGRDYAPRAQQARKIWYILSSYTLDLFHEKVAPILCDHLASVIPDRFFSAAGQPVVAAEREHQCLRHAVVRRVRIETMADRLCHHGLLPVKDYGTIINDGSVGMTTKWDIIFDALKTQTPIEQRIVEEEVQQLLKRYNVPHPDRLADCLARGVPCCCEHTEPDLPNEAQNTHVLVEHWLGKSRTGSSLRSSESSLTRVDGSMSLSSQSLSSSPRPVSYLDTASLASSSSCTSFHLKRQEPPTGFAAKPGNILLSASDVHIDMPFSVYNGEPSTGPEDTPVEQDNYVRETTALLSKPKDSPHKDQPMSSTNAGSQTLSDLSRPDEAVVSVDENNKTEASGTGAAFHEDSILHYFGVIGEVVVLKVRALSEVIQQSPRRVAFLCTMLRFLSALMLSGIFVLLISNFILGKSITWLEKTYIALLMTFIGTEMSLVLLAAALLLVILCILLVKSFIVFWRSTFERIKKKQ